MPNRSKDKGSREERAVVQYFRNLGIKAQRTLEAGARSDGSNTWDIDAHVKGIDYAPLVGECKIRQDGFKQLYKWLGENDFLTVRANQKERLFVIPERVFTDLIK